MKIIDRENFSMAVTFVVEIITAVLIFIVIASAAAFLTFFIDFLESYNVSGKLITALTVLEHFLFSIDVVLFLLMVLYSTHKAAKQLVTGWLLYPVAIFGLSGAGYMTYELSGK